MAREKQQIPKHPIQFLWYIATKNKWLMFLATFFVVLASIATASWPYIIKQITNTTTIDQNHELAVKWIITFGVVFLLTGLFWRGSGFSGMQWVTRSRAIVVQELMEYLTHHSEAYFRDRFSGSIVNKLKNVMNGVASLLETYLWALLEITITLPIALYLGFGAHPLIGWCLVIWIACIIPVNIIFVIKKRKYSIAHAESSSELTGQAVDIVSNMSSVRQHAKKSTELRHIGRYIEKYRKANLKNWFVSEWMLVTNDLVQSLLFIVILSICAVLWKDGVITGGDVLMMLTIGINISHSLMWIGNNINTMMDSYGEIYEGLDHVIVGYDVEDSKDAKQYLPAGGQILFENVSFSYGKINVFPDLSFRIEPGQKVGLVGESGAGKSTLVQLLLRQYDIQSGSIRFDGQEIRNLTQDSLRENIAFVPQDPALFHRTLRENIAYGDPDVSLDDVIQAAKLAQAHEFIEKLEDGYETMVGERGVKLSGGQRQRIVIARAFLKNAPILILDEATSALDSESEEKVQKALLELMKGKTVIAIAHRLSTIRNLDRILVFEDGNIIEDGSHDDLTSKNGHYARLWKKQVGGFIGE